jgi:Raf kinase inhibitor-like YbhB/YbcL family protein
MANTPSDLRVTSNLFADGEHIPKSAAHPMAGGQNISPDLHWDAVTEGTASVAVTTYDPDAPTTVGFVHWVLFNLDPQTRELEAGAGAAGKNPPDSVLGFTDWGVSEYGGMAPPPGDPPHHYHFTVYALDIPRIESGPTTTYALFRFQIRGHVLAQGTLTGLYEIPASS